MKKIVAITGGIGSGKSAVLSIIEGLGYPVISADNVNRELLQNNDYLRELKSAFNDAFINEKLDKKALANIIFHDEVRRLALNSIAHRHIRVLINKKIDNIMAKVIFVEVPLLVESGMVDMFDEVIVVTADKETKIARVMKRDNLSREDVLARIASQLDDGALMKVATHVISNNSTYNALKEETEKIVNAI